MNAYEDTLEEIFQLMREGNIVLFVGAGFSAKAGLPTGSQLAHKLIETFLSSDEVLAYSNKSLSDIVDRIIYEDKDKVNENKRKLYDFLKNIFIVERSEGSLQNDFKTIPYITDIITTNYDNLFELSYQDHLNVVYDNDTFSKRKVKNTTLYKIHGDFNRENTIILAKRDYSKFIADSNRNMIAAKLKEFFASKNILFIGFSFEDINISGLYDEIISIYNTAGKQHYFVAPNELQHKINRINDMGFKYINLTAEEITSYLVECTKKSLLHDLEDEIISYDKVKYVTSEKGFIPEILSKSGNVQIKTITPIGQNGMVYNGVLSINRNLSEQYELFRKATAGETIDPVCFTGEFINRINIKVAGFELENYTDIKELVIAPQPVYSGKGKLFYNNIYNCDIDVELYASKNELKAKMQHKYISIEFRSNFIESSYKINIKYNDDSTSIYSKASSFKEILEFFSCENIQVYVPNNSDPIFMIDEDTYKSSEYQALRDEVNYYYELFSALNNIQNFFNIIFNPDYGLYNGEIKKIFIIQKMIKGTPCNMRFEINIPASEENTPDTITIDKEYPAIAGDLYLSIADYKFRLYDWRICKCRLKRKNKTRIINGKECVIYSTRNNLIPFLCTIALEKQE